MGGLKRHVITCLLSGLVALLPVGGTIFLVVMAEKLCRPLVPASFYIPGVGLIAVVVLLYLLGLTVTTFIGRWFWTRLDRLLARVPALGMLYKTLKQVLGYGSGEGALFHRVVLVEDQATGAAELGLVTGTEGAADGARLLVFVPGSPNPSQGRLLRLPPARAVPIDLPVDRALKELFSLGKLY
jgi:uncharacterized membrane protein